MYKPLLVGSRLLCLCLFFSGVVAGQAPHPGAVPMPTARFITGNDAAWSNSSFDDKDWKEIKTGRVWQSQGYPSYHGYAWYRIHVVIPSSLKTNAHWKDSLRIFLAHVNDVDETFLNGKKIGQIGAFPEDPGGYISKWPAVREYHVPVSDPAIKWDQENVIAVKDYDGGGSGGIFMGDPYLDMLERTDGISVTLSNETMHYTSDGNMEWPVAVQNAFNTPVEGVLTWKVMDAVSEKQIDSKEITVQLAPLATKEFKLSTPSREGILCQYTFTEKTTGMLVSGDHAVPYILTPAPSAAPRINSAKIFGVRPGSPFLFKVAATGDKPLTYKVGNLPAGLSVDAATGIIRGKVDRRGDYSLSVTVTNAKGKATQVLKVKVGDTLALTPPMGWNSWNCWGLTVSDEKLHSSAQALIDKGLIDHGWTYMNIDDGWEQPQRDQAGNVIPNNKFPDMHGLSDWLHDRGLKFGIYSSPGPLTCGGYLGSYQHEAQDAATYASWGIDYLKYDWCSYGDIAKGDTTLAGYMKPYQVMQKALRSQNRDILYSLCQYGMKDVWKWGGSVDAQCWRTTGDITDTWQSLSRIGFTQASHYPYARPGNWNDPDMMIVGQVGWGENLHPSRLTPDEQYTHVSLWCLLSAPLLIGCDLSRLDPFTINLLTNDEVLAVDQDVLGRQARQVVRNDQYQVWVKDLEDGSVAIGLFNTGSHSVDINAVFKDLGLPAERHIRDLWRQKDLGTFHDAFHSQVAPHGVRLLKASK